MRNLFLTIFIAIISAICCNKLIAQTEPAQTQPAIDTAQIPTTQITPMSQDDLPDSTLHGNLLAVVVLDLTKGDKTAWTNSWMVISGGSATTQPVPDSAAMPMGLEQSLGPIFRMGAERLVYAVSMDGNSQIITLGLRLHQGTSDIAAVKWLRQNVGSAARFEQDGLWLVTRVNARNGGMANGAEVNPVSEQVREELNCGGDLPVKAVYLTTDSLKTALMRGGPPPGPLVGITKLYWTAKYLYIGAELGANPQVEVRWIAPDEAGADAAIAEFSNMRQQLKQPNNGIGIPMSIVSVLDQFHPTKEGNIARISLQKKELSQVFTAVLVASMSGNQPQQPPQAAVQQSHIDSAWQPMDPATDSASGQMRLILSAIAEYDDAHQSLPASLDDLVSAGLVPGPEIFHNPRSGKDNGFVYVKPDGVTKLADISARDTTPILFEEKDGKADNSGLVGYADGHVGNGK